MAVGQKFRNRGMIFLVQVNSPVERLLADARLRLVETGTRNRLVHTPRGGKRTRSMPITGVDADGLFESLARSGRAMRFLPANLERELATEIQSRNVDRSRTSAEAPTTTLQTNLDERTLEKRLLSIYRDAKTAEEEQGINILFLAIGFLRWYEDDRSDVPREAPLILVPVSLTRDRRRSTFELRRRDEDISTNQPIQERLRADVAVVLPDIPEDDEWVPVGLFRGGDGGHRGQIPLVDRSQRRRAWVLLVLQAPNDLRPRTRGVGRKFHPRS